MDANEAEAEKLADTVALTWTVTPDRASQEIDALRRGGWTVEQIATGVRAMIDSHHKQSIAKPFGWLRKRLENLGGGMRSVGGVLKAIPEPTRDTYEPREGPGHIWRRNGKSCASCNERKRTGRAGAGIMVAHSCGEAVPMVEILKAEDEKRRDEVKFFEECPRCRGAGFVWSYDRRGRSVATTVRGQCSFRDTRGVRYLVECGCA